MLLIRQLDHFSTEESIYNAVSSLEGVVRTLLIRDKMTRMSCEFAFIEFSEIKVLYNHFVCAYTRKKKTDIYI